MHRYVVVSLVLALAADAFGLLPESIAEVSDEYTTPHVTFTLYRRNHGNTGSVIIMGDRESLKKSGFDSKLPVVLAAHGWLCDATKSSVQGIRKGFHARTDVNFIAIDWSKHSNTLLYDRAALATKAVGLHVSRFLRFLTSETGLKIKDFHIMGHSLGAHVASFASNAFPNEKIGRITGFDPAAPLMDKLPPEDRLDSGDAHFVDVIHTCVHFLGMTKPIGTVDFYVNGGYGQPGCGIMDLRCHHNMSHRFFAHAVHSGKDYRAVKCGSLEQASNHKCNGTSAPMGMRSRAAKPGIYYVKISQF